MKRVDCPIHGESVLRLAQGRLGFAEAVRAEQTGKECEHCRAWWLETFDSQSNLAVDQSVREAIQEFQPPRPVRRVQWDYVAAAALVVLVVGSLLFLPGASEMRRARSTGAVPDELGVARTDLILSEGFEGEPILTPVIGRAALPGSESGASLHPDESAEEGDKIFTDDLEQGSFEGWSQHS
jgi:hypothetical protein